MLLVSTSPCCRASCAKKFALLGLMVGVSAIKFALHAQNTPKSAFLRLLGEFFRGRAAGGAMQGEFCRGLGPAWRSCLLDGLMLSEAPLALQGLASG